MSISRVGGGEREKEEDVYEVMCSPECTLNDALHEQIMADSKCTCTQLSTPYSNLEADFCSANSARMLCKQYKPLHAMGTKVMSTEDNLWADKPGREVAFDQVPPIGPCCHPNGCHLSPSCRTISRNRRTGAEVNLDCEVTGINGGTPSLPNNPACRWMQGFSYIDAARIKNWNDGKANNWKEGTHSSSKGSLEVCGAWSCPL